MASGTPPAQNAAQNSETVRKKQTTIDVQKQQLERLMKDPTKPVNIPAPPKEKTIRPAREMMKNVQGSSAGAGSGEFHVYKQSRRREYERLKIMEEESKKELETAEFEAKKREREEQSEAKTAKNRARRQKKKNRAMGKGAQDGPSGNSEDPTKRRRLAADGANVVFRRPGESSDDDESGPIAVVPQPAATDDPSPLLPPDVKIAEPTQIIIHDD
ncbi:unnamed protein product [Rhizoctonia solani]|uniref:DUF1168-domain-containing protein n=1 Tax=Rhizoctonia solani TaxID=456999 RepID=A0A8H3BSC8_9AGAM|nr:unnamed protein product [Rhizoctonia solani]CAE7070644.1 unnamed protein product [Rhizoctonia solani]